MKGVDVMLKSLLAGALIYAVALISVFLIINHLDVSIKIIKKEVSKDGDNKTNA